MNTSQRFGGQRNFLGGEGDDAQGLFLTALGGA